MDENNELSQIEEMRIEILHDKNNSSKDDEFQIYLKRAKDTAIKYMFPYQYSETIELPENLTNWQTECAIELYKRRSGVGLKSYSENDLSETYETMGISQRLISQLPPPKAGVPN